MLDSHPVRRPGDRPPRGRTALRTRRPPGWSNRIEPLRHRRSADQLARPLAEPLSHCRNSEQLAQPDRTAPSLPEGRDQLARSVAEPLRRLPKKVTSLPDLVSPLRRSPKRSTSLLDRGLTAPPFRRTTSLLDLDQVPCTIRRPAGFLDRSPAFEFPPDVPVSRSIRLSEVSLESGSLRCDGEFLLAPRGAHKGSRQRSS